MRAQEKPGRAGSVRTSGEGPSAITCERSCSSRTTMRRMDFVALTEASLVELRAHHDEGHLAAVIGVAPGVPASDLHHHVAGLERALPVVGDQHALARKQNPVVEGLRLVRARGKEVLPAALPGAAFGPLRGMRRLDEGVLRRIVVPGLGGRLHHAQMSARARRLEMERQVAVVARARDHGGATVEHPQVGHVGALLERARLDVGRRAVEQHAGASLRVVAGHHPPDRLDRVAHALRLRWNEWKSAAPLGAHGLLAMAYMSVTTSTTTGLFMPIARVSASSSSPGSVTRMPAQPKASATLVKSMSGKRHISSARPRCLPP